MRSRRNNLIISGLEELAGEAGDGDPAAIIWTFLADNLDIFGVCIQLVHRMGPLRHFGRRQTPHEPRQSNARSIIVCFRDFQDVERIMSNAHILQSREYGINRDCPDEAVKAIFRLWADYKNAKHKHHRGKVSLRSLL